MRNFVMSDMHGHEFPARALLDYAGVDLSKDKLRFLGDYIDRGPNSLGCIRLVQKYQRQGAIAHIGNHELMFMMFMAGHLETNLYYQNGGDAMFKSIDKAMEEGRFGQDDMDQLLYWISNLKMTDEDDEYFYVHAGIHPEMPLSHQATDQFLWIREDFLEASPEELAEQTKGKIIVHGHTPMENVCFDGIKINTDVGAGGRKKLALLELTEQVAYVYDFQQARLNGRDYAITKVPIQNNAPVSLY